MRAQDQEPDLTGADLTEVSYERRGPAGWLTLNRPGKRNALSPRLVSELLRALDSAGQDPGLRALVITGAGPAFCAGADLAFFREMLDGGSCDEFMNQLLEPLVRFLAGLRELPVPVIAAVNGACVAGGLEMVLCCDIVLASKTATFADAHSRHGILPAVGAVSALVRSIGAHRAKRLLLASETFDAQTLCHQGIVTEVLDSGRLLPRAQQLAEELSERSPVSMAILKAAVQRSEAPSWEDHVAADLSDFRAIWGSPQMREGISAYAQRRAAVYG
jgi:enoyl-CoA hydratase